MEGVGASEVAARQALIASEGDMDRAIEMLLA
jgi:NACalpha-BTF3-like transcription factor